MKRKNCVTIIGHKNPDTDSICSAVAYAALKNKISPENRYVPARCGEINKETAFVLKTFGVEEPEFIKDVRSQVSDIEMKQVEGVDSGISLRQAYALMKKQNAVTLVATTPDGCIEGLITVGDIAESDMDVYDNRIVSKAATPYKNIVETLDGRLLCGDINGCFSEGRVSIAANTPEMMGEYVGEKDLVIMGNRFESQFVAIELGVGCIVLCTDNTVKDAVLKLAKERGTVIISSPYDTYTVARLLNKSMPVKYFMTSENLLVFSIDDYTNDVKDVMAKNRHRYFPVIDERGKYIGQISKRSFLDMEKKKVILVDHNERNQAVDGIEFADIMEIIDHHRLGNLETMNPVFFRNQPLGCTATIVYMMYCENNAEIPKEIAGILCGAILSDTLMFRSPTCTPADEAAARALADIAGVEVQSFAENMFSAGSDFASRTEEDIFYQDYKEFSAAGVSFGVGQITSMNNADLLELKGRIDEYMNGLISRSGMDMLVFMLTNIVDESSILIFKGENAVEYMETAFGGKAEGGSMFVESMVSRKKQLIPSIISAIQQ